MGKGTLEAPDAAELPAPGAAGPASADDLLAQIAGEEIDRLLAEVDVQPEDDAAAPQTDSAPPSFAPPVAEPPPAALAPIAEPDVSQQLDDLFNQLVEGDEEAETQPQASLPAGGVSVGSAVSQELKTAVTELDPAPPEPSALPAAPAAAPETSNEKLPIAEASVPGSVVAEAATSLAERSALDLTSEPAAALETDADLEPDAPTNRPLPFYLRPLEWIFAPLEACPDALRDVLGKIALLTLFNSAAVLIYIHFFRKH